MPESQYRARQVSAKTHEVVDYNNDDSRPGKPLYIMIPGGLLALAVLAVIVYVAYLTWFAESLAEGTGIGLITLLAPFYVGAVFLFSYGYELYNIPRALRLTAIIVFFTVAAVVIVAVLFFLLGNTSTKKDGSSKSSSKASSKSSGKSFSSSSSGGASKSSNSPQRSSGGGVTHVMGGGPIFVGGGTTRVETREVEKRVEVPIAPRSIDCPFCGRSYVPSEQDYACPACGASTPKEMIEESEAPK